MQIMIDSAADGAAYLRRVAKFLNEEADIREKEECAAPPTFKIAPALLPVEVPVDTAAVGFGKQPAGLDGHGAAPKPVMVPSSTIAPPPPGASAGVSQPATVAVEKDSAGIPWDARIHQETRGKKVDSTWKLKKGLDPAIATAVIAELRAANPAPAQPIPQQAPPPPVTQVAPPPPSETTTSQPAAVPQAQVAASPAPSVTAFRELMQKVTASTNAGKLTNIQVDAALASVDLPPRQLVSLVQHPEKIAGVSAYIDACLAAAA